MQSLCKCFPSQDDFDDHVKIHERIKMHKCNQCEQSFSSQDSMNIHMETHDVITSRDEFKCYKCEKVYMDPRKLRRHDWRAHRTIECKICDDTLSSRLELKQHREHKHQMFKKIACKYFPDCYDGEECLYEHTNIQNESKEAGCQNGENCYNQDCTFNENEHKILKKVMCKFQERCNRGGCQYQHKNQRKPFLGLSTLKDRKL